MIDLVLQGTNKKAIRDWLEASDMFIDRVDIPAQFTVNEETGEKAETAPAVMKRQKRQGVEWTWWNGTGKLMTKRGVYDADGNETAAPIFAVGVWALVRFHHKYLLANMLDVKVNEGDEIAVWDKLKFAQDVYDAGINLKDFPKEERPAERKKIRVAERVEDRTEKRVWERTVERRIERDAVNIYDRDFDTDLKRFNAIRYIEDGGIKIFTKGDIDQLCATMGVPGHTY